METVTRSEPNWRIWQELAQSGGDEQPMEAFLEAVRTCVRFLDSQGSSWHSLLVLHMEASKGREEHSLRNEYRLLLYRNR